MGGFDRWSTPKQIKMERAGDPRPLRRGALKRGERKKGRKARWDEVLSAYKTWQTYQKWYIDAVNRGEEKRGIFGTDWHKDTTEKARAKYAKTIESFIKDYEHANETLL